MLSCNEAVDVDAQTSYADAL